VDAQGNPVCGVVGELVVRRPWVGMTHGFWNDPQRYLETYWSRIPDVWVHGDWALIADDGFWYIQGRSDDTLKIAGKRVGPAEVESAAVAHPAVQEAAAIGVPHAVKGEVVVVFCIPRPGVEPTAALAAEVLDAIARQMGKALKPEAVKWVRELPKTRNAKILRRVVRGAYLGQSDLGDLTALENPSAIQEVASTRACACAAGGRRRRARRAQASTTVQSGAATPRTVGGSCARASVGGGAGLVTVPPRRAGPVTAPTERPFAAAVRVR
jgi:acetyl-CoA synthetase